MNDAEAFAALRDDLRKATARNVALLEDLRYERERTAQLEAFIVAKRLVPPPKLPNTRLKALLFEHTTTVDIWAHIFDFLDFNDGSLCISGEVQLRGMCKTFKHALVKPKCWTVEKNSSGPWTRSCLSDALVAATYARFKNMDIQHIKLAAGMHRAKEPKFPTHYHDSDWIQSIQREFWVTASNLTISGCGLGKTIIVGCVVLHHHFNAPRSLFEHGIDAFCLTNVKVRFEDLTISNPRGCGVEIRDENLRTLYNWDDALPPNCPSCLTKWKLQIANTMVLG